MSSLDNKLSENDIGHGTSAGKKYRVYSDKDFLFDFFFDFSFAWKIFSRTFPAQYIVYISPDGWERVFYLLTQSAVA